MSKERVKMSYQHLERSYCSCEKCVQVCHDRNTMKILSHDDIVNIAGKLDISVYDFLEDYCYAEESVGKAIILLFDWKSKSCKFHVMGRCSIHSVAPFTCRLFKFCSDSKEHNKVRGQELLESIQNNKEYAHYFDYLQLLQENEE